MAKEKEPQSRLAGRSAEDGRFIKIEEARKHPRTSVVERLALPGKGEKSK